MMSYKHRVFEYYMAKELLEVLEAEGFMAKVYNEGLLCGGFRDFRPTMTWAFQDLTDQQTVGAVIFLEDLREGHVSGNGYLIYLQRLSDFGWVVYLDLRGESIKIRELTPEETAVWEVGIWPEKQVEGVKGSRYRRNKLLKVSEV